MSNGPDVKVVLLGRHNAGKTCLSDRFINEQYSALPYQTTIGAAFGAKRIDVEGKSIVMGVWDTAGSERYESLSKMFYRGAWAAVVCFDLSDSDSFDRVKFWVTELKANEEKCRIFLCGTKKDKVEADKAFRQVDYHAALEYADENGAQYLETSSQTGENVRTLFETIAEAYVHSSTFKSHKPKTSNVNLPLNRSTPRSGCRCSKGS